MIIDLPASIELELEQYAQAEHITPVETAVKLIQSGLKSKRSKAIRRELTEADWEQLRQDPTVAFFGGLSDHTLEQMEMVSKQIHAERFTPRG